MFDFYLPSYHAMTPVKEELNTIRNDNVRTINRIIYPEMMSMEMIYRLTIDDFFKKIY